jgi:hypothetical protein
LAGSEFSLTNDPLPQEPSPPILVSAKDKASVRDGLIKQGIAWAAALVFFALLIVYAGFRDAVVSSVVQDLKSDDSKLLSTLRDQIASK